jgi:hypothetical protein
MLHTAVTLAHELGHVLLAYEGYSMDKINEEGICQFISYIWLMRLAQIRQTSEDIKFSMTEILQKIAKIQGGKERYSEGFWKTLEAIKQERTFGKLLTNKKIEEPPPVVYKKPDGPVLALGVVSIALMAGFNMGLYSLPNLDMSSVWKSFKKVKF